MRAPISKQPDAGSVPSELRERIARAAPAFVGRGAVRRGRKSCLISGALDGVAELAAALRETLAQLPDADSSCS